MSQFKVLYETQEDTMSTYTITSTSFQNQTNNYHLVNVNCLKINDSWDKFHSSLSNSNWPRKFDINDFSFRLVGKITYERVSSLTAIMAELNDIYNNNTTLPDNGAIDAALYLVRDNQKREIYCVIYSRERYISSDTVVKLVDTFRNIRLSTHPDWKADIDAGWYTLGVPEK